MGPSAPRSDDELELPPFDGDLAGDREEDGAEAVHEELEEPTGGENPLDDATSEHEPYEDLEVQGAEGGWLTESEDAGAIDVGTFDLGLSEEGSVLGEDDVEPHGADEEIGGLEGPLLVDGGEEGPLDEDEELRPEDLPALDADDEGEVDDATLYDHTMLGEQQEELRWDDRAWARVDAPGDVREELDDSGALALPGDDPAQSARDVVWRRFDEVGRVMAVAFLPGGSVVVALVSPERPLLVRILPDGAARIIAEIELPGDDDAEGCRVTHLRWDAARGLLLAVGTFGAQAFRPA